MHKISKNITKKKKTKINQLIILAISMETNLSKIGDGDEVSKKLRQSKSLCKKKTKKRRVVLFKQVWCVLIFRKKNLGKKNCSQFKKIKEKKKKKKKRKVKTWKEFKYLNTLFYKKKKKIILNLKTNKRVVLFCW